MPIDSPSSIHSDAPSARVRMYSETSSSAPRPAPRSPAVRREQRLVGARKRARSRGDRGHQGKIVSARTTARACARSEGHGVRRGRRWGSRARGRRRAARSRPASGRSVATSRKRSSVTLGHQRAAGHGVGAEDHARRRRALSSDVADVDAVDAQLVGHHLGLERPAVDVAAGQQPVGPPAFVDHAGQRVPEAGLVAQLVQRLVDVVDLVALITGESADQADARTRRRPHASPVPALPVTLGHASAGCRRRCGPTPMPPSTQSAAVVTIR